MKKLISRRNFLKVCALAGSAAALSACGGGKSNGGNNSAAAAVDVTGAVTFPLSEKVTFTGMTSFPVGSEPEPNNRTIFKRLEEQTNVHIDWTAIQSDQWSDKITLNMSNPNTLTDFVFTADFTDSNLLRYADQGVILNLEDYIDNNMPYLQKVFEQYPEYRTMCTDSDGHIWALPWIEQLGAEKTAIQTVGNMSFINTKWLNFLGLSMPTTVDEFEQVLIAFRDNADELLGADADKMIPYSVSYDVGWRAATLIESFIDPDISDKEYYVNGFDDRKLTQNGTKEGVRLLNKWYNEGLMWKDFALYGSGDTTEDDNLKAGYVGAFTHNWDYPFRNGEDSIQANLQRLVGEDAKFVAVDCFEDSKGTHTKFTAGPIDRKLFFPSTNDEPLASMLYLDWISDPEHIQYLQIGEEGVTHDTLDDGTIVTKASTGDTIQNSGFNIDMTITCNGLKLVDPEITTKSIAYSYSNVDPADVETADAIAKTDNRPGKNVNVGAISAEEGMGDSLSSKRDIVYDTAVSAAEADFDKVWDSGIEEYLGAGGQAIMDERAAKWEATFGSSDMLP